MTSTSRLLIVSTSTIHGSGYLEYILPEVANFFHGRENLIFIPYARPGGISHDGYTELAQKAFASVGLSIRGLHTFDDPAQAIREAGGFFTGGGNTFVLLKTLYERELIPALQAAVGAGTPYMGTSAGANLTGLTVNTTNDMPIVHPPSLDALAFVPFNINPHYLDPIEGSTHMGETRETRIKEFHHFNTQPVLGLREGSWLRLENNQLELKGPHTARLFNAGKTPEELQPGPVNQLLSNA